jgi:DUF1365 family protein
MNGSALYAGQVRHRRRGDVDNTFTYRMWHVLLDLDEIPGLARSIPFFGFNRFNLVGFDDRDHMGPSPRPLRDKLAEWFRARGTELPPGRVLLLTGLRHLGWSFDPVSFYYCYDQHDVLAWVVAEVNNTFGETYCYLLPAPEDPAATVVTHETDKSFHVSPFQPITGTYRFRVTAPDDRLTAHIDVMRNGKPVFDATLSERRRPLDARSLLSTILRHPHQTAMTLFLIHYQAVRLWLKRAPFFSKPAPPAGAWRTR